MNCFGHITFCCCCCCCCCFVRYQSSNCSGMNVLKMTCILLWLKMKLTPSFWDVGTYMWLLVQTLRSKGSGESLAGCRWYAQPNHIYYIYKWQAKISHLCMTVDLWTQDWPLTLVYIIMYYDRASILMTIHIITWESYTPAQSVCARVRLSPIQDKDLICDSSMYKPLMPGKYA